MVAEIARIVSRGIRAARIFSARTQSKDADHCPRASNQADVIATSVSWRSSPKAAPIATRGLFGFDPDRNA